MPRAQTLSPSQPVSSTLLDFSLARRYNAQIALRLIAHEPSGSHGLPRERHALIVVEDNVYLNKLVKTIQTRLGWSARPRVLWMDARGETTELTSQVH